VLFESHGMAEGGMAQVTDQPVVLIILHFVIITFW
jgi:hypothetical protein